MYKSMGIRITVKHGLIYISVLHAFCYRLFLQSKPSIKAAMGNSHNVGELEQHSNCVMGIIDSIQLTAIGERQQQ